MKKIRFIYLLVYLLGLAPANVSAISCMQQGPDTIRTGTVISGSCIINGDLVILNGGSLHVDLTGPSADTFIVRGNIVLQGNARLFINADSGTGAQFIVSNSYNNQRTITTLDSSQIVLQHLEFRTQEGDLSSASSYYMNYYANNNSALSVTQCILNQQTAWLLLNLNDHSSLISSQTNEMPTEVYLQDTAQMSVHGVSTKIGIWMLFSTTTDTLNLPDQTGSFYSWQVGRGFGGVSASTWFLQVDSALPGIGVQVNPTAKLVVNGRGVPTTGEIHANILFANGSDTIQNLTVGLQTTTVARGRLTLNNVSMGPIPWQLYSLSNEHLLIKNSIVNEIGIEGPANTILVDSSWLQLATLSALGTSGTTLTINNSKIWSQAIAAANSSSITLNNCSVTGSWFSTIDTISHITVNGGCFYQNPTGCTQNTMVNVSTGVPNCNPFIPPGFPRNQSPANVSFNGVNTNCTNSVENINGNNLNVTLYPNPAQDYITLAYSSASDPALTFEVYNAFGQLIEAKNAKDNSSTQINITSMSNGVYFVRIREQGSVIQTLKLVIAK